MPTSRTNPPTPPTPPRPEPMASRLAGLLIDDDRRPRRLFTPEAATATLPLVGRIAADAVAACRRARALHGCLERADNPKHARRLKRRLARAADRLEGLAAEMRAVGCELTDCRAGTVEFAARHAGRRVTLSWRPGEPAVSHWHNPREPADRRRPLP